MFLNSLFKERYLGRRRCSRISQTPRLSSSSSTSAPPWRAAAARRAAGLGAQCPDVVRSHPQRQRHKKLPGMLTHSYHRYNSHYFASVQKWEQRREVLSQNTLTFAKTYKCCKNKLFSFKKDFLTLKYIKLYKGKLYVLPNCNQEKIKLMDSPWI